MGGCIVVILGCLLLRVSLRLLTGERIFLNCHRVNILHPKRLKIFSCKVTLYHNASSTATAYKAA